MIAAMFLVTALMSYIFTSTQDEGVGGGEEDEEGEETKARGKGKATPTTAVSNEGAADSDMTEPQKSSATRTKRTVDAAGKRSFAPLKFAHMRMCFLERCIQDGYLYLLL